MKTGIRTIIETYRNYKGKKTPFPAYLVVMVSDSEIQSAISSILGRSLTESEGFIPLSTSCCITLSKKVSLIAVYYDKLYSIYTSKSWGYTAPLRKIASHVRGASRFIPRKPV